MYFQNYWRLNKEKFTRSIFKFNCKYNEHAPLQLVQSFVSNKQGITLKSNRVLGKIYETENIQMSLYLKKYDKKECVFKVKYNLPAHKWGRINPEKSLSLCIFHRPTRHAFCIEIYIDIDMYNAHPAIISNLCRLNIISSPTIDYYCANRKVFLQNICQHHDVNRSSAKKPHVMSNIWG